MQWLGERGLKLFHSYKWICCQLWWAVWFCGNTTNMFKHRTKKHEKEILELQQKSRKENSSGSRPPTERQVLWQWVFFHKGSVKEYPGMWCWKLNGHIGSSALGWVYIWVVKNVFQFKWYIFDYSNANPKCKPMLNCSRLHQSTLCHF